MDCPIEFSVYDNDRTAGKLQVKQEGLYYVFSCHLELQSSRILRLYVIQGFTVVPLGVLMPTGSGLTLEHKISVDSWPLEGVDTALCGYSPEAGWLPWRGTIEHTQLYGWIKTDETDYLLAVDVSKTPFPLIENLSDAEPLTLSGVDCMCVKINRAGEILQTHLQTDSAENTPEKQEETDE